MKIKELREKRGKVYHAMTELGNKIKEEKRSFNEEENEQFERMDKELLEIDNDIQKLERLLQIEQQYAEDNQEEENEEQRDDKPKYKDVFWRAMRYGVSTLNAEERSLLAQNRGTDPQTTTPDTAGGYLVPEGFSGELFKEMVAFGGMLGAARTLNTTSGNPIPWPTLNDTAVVGSILAETAQAVVSDMTLGVKQLDAYTYTSHIVKLSVELIQDDAINLQGLLRELFAERLGRGMNAHFTTGTGSSQPNGVAPASGLGKTAASATAITRGELIDLIHSIDPSYRNGARFMFNDSTLAAIKKLSIGTSDDRPLWVPSMREGAPDTIEGYAYSINQDMASIATGNKSVLFGDFSKYIIRLAGNTTMLTLRERYADYLHVGFIAYQRADGELLSANAVKHLIQA